ncbi:MAG: hypothetical protein ACYDGR_04925 [Candidatus Dormibacteria bacterium]
MASDLNYVGGSTVPNLVPVKVSPDGTVTLYNFAGAGAGAVDVIVDVQGWVS